MNNQINVYFILKIQWFTCLDGHWKTQPARRNVCEKTEICISTFLGPQLTYVIIITKPLRYFPSSSIWMFVFRRIKQPTPDFYSSIFHVVIWKRSTAFQCCDNWFSTIQPEISRTLKTPECQKTKSWEYASDRSLWCFDAKRLHSALPLHPAGLDVLSMAHSILFHVSREDTRK